MGKGGGRGGGGGGGGTRFRFMRGFLSKIFGPSPGTMDALNRVALARGLRDADELLGRLGKSIHEVSKTEAINMLFEECSCEEVHDYGQRDHYKAGKGYRPCNNLLNRYLKVFKDPDSTFYTKLYLKELKTYCGYTDEELNSLMN